MSVFWRYYYFLKLLTMSLTNGDAYSRNGRRRSSRTFYNSLKNQDNINCGNAVIDVDVNSGEDEGLTIEIQTKPLTDYYTLDGDLGRGKFATVKQCFCKETGQVYAAKFQRKRRKAKDARADIIAEIKLLEMCKIHPSIVKIVAVFETQHEIVIITEHCAGGELFTFMEDVETGFDEDDVRHIMKQTLEGLSFLHQRNVVHMDIKPQNILLTEKSLLSQIKICDLGFSRTVLNGEDVRDLVGTPDFVAPEVLNYEPISMYSDMWSVGVLSYMLLTGHSPFAGCDKMETYSNITSAKLEYPSSQFTHISQAAQDFIRKLLIKNPNKRMTVFESLNHKWLQDVMGIETLEKLDNQDVASSTPVSPVEHVNAEPCTLTASANHDNTVEEYPSLSSLENHDVTSSRITSIVPATLITSGPSVEYCHITSNIQSTHQNAPTIVPVELCSDGVQYMLLPTLHEAEEEEEMYSIVTPYTIDCFVATATTSTVTKSSPMASPIGLRRALTSSPTTIRDNEPSSKQLCQREQDVYKVEANVLLNMDISDDYQPVTRRRLSCLSHKTIQLSKIVSPSQKHMQLQTH